MFLIASALAADMSVCAEFGEPSAPIEVTGEDILTPTEPSGLTASRSHPGRYFTHEDAGHEAALFILERTDAGAEIVGKQLVQGAVNTDWEDIASGPCPAAVDAESCLWIGDIGDNDDVRTTIDVWVVPETMDAIVTAVHCPLAYDGGKRYDAEALFVSPQGVLRVVTKEADGEAKIYSLTNPRCDGGAAQTLVREAELFLGEEVNGGAMNEAGTAVILRGPTKAWQWTGCDIPWSDDPTVFDLGEQFQGEAVAFLPDGGVMSTSEVDSLSGDPFQIWETPCLETKQLECPTCGCGGGNAGTMLVFVPILLARRRRAARTNLEGRT